ncbi:MAG: D-alanyl-D-alanine carboxypeptidase, partial [Verrucomicrobiales bacterium]|nr:D-alanyl-D-alanine carboxypeptidase [Verrucomicrobiales bacterium]
MANFLKNSNLFRAGTLALVAGFGTSGCFWNDEPSPSPGGFSGTGQSAYYGGQDSFIVVDWNYGKILAEQNADKKRPVAGLAQVATAMVVLDWIGANSISKGSLIAIPNTAPQFGQANPLGLQPGDRISVRDAVSSMILARDPVAAEALALHFGWQMSRQAGGRNGMLVFVEQMNALAERLDMNRTKFENAHGLSVMGRPGYSTARDMAKLANYAIKNPRFNFHAAQSSR